MVQLLGLHSSNTVGTGSNPVWGTKIPHVFVAKKKKIELKKIFLMDFPGGAVDKNPPGNAGDTGSILGQVRLHMPRGN